MTYRTPEALGALCLEAGYKKENITLWTEPVGLHTVVQARH